MGFCKSIELFGGLRGLIVSIIWLCSINYTTRIIITIMATDTTDNIDPIDNTNITDTIMAPNSIAPTTDGNDTTMAINTITTATANMTIMATDSTATMATPTIPQPPPTLTIALPPNQHHSSAKTLMGLPLELREQIWRHVLVTPAKHHLKHVFDCRYRHGHARPTSIEPAACMVLEPNVELAEPKVYPWDEPSHCRCAKRPGLNLLLVSGQVHREAAPVFWRENDFIFQSSDEFTHCVGARLRDKYRALLGSVYVGSCAPWETDRRTTWNYLKEERTEPMPRWCQFWGVLNQCRGLRRLAVRPEVVKRHATDVKRLAHTMPMLRRLELTFVGRYLDRSTAFERDWGCFRACGGIQRDAVFVRAEMPVEIRGEGRADASPEGCKEMYRSFTTNFCVYVNRIVRERFLVPSSADVDLDDGRIEFHAPGGMAEGLDDLNDEHEVELPTGKTARLAFMGTPQSRRTRVALGRERMARDAKRRRAGLPSLGEEKALEEGARRRERRREYEICDELNRRERVLEKRKSKAAERKEAEQKEREAQREELARVMERAKEERKAGRKRVAKVEEVEVREEVEEVEEVLEEEETVAVRRIELKAPTKKKNAGKKGGKRKGMRRKGDGEAGKESWRESLDAWDAPADDFGRFDEW